jgi:hypothetical protein
MNIREQFATQDVEVRQFDYGDRRVLAADFGATASSSVDVVGDTVIVVVDDEQYDIEVGDGAETAMNNGVLTIEVPA